MNPTTSRAVVTTIALLVITGCSSDPAVGASISNAVEKKDDFFTHDKLFFIRIDGWDPARMTPASLAEYQEHDGARVKIYESVADSPNHCPDGEGELVYQGDDFKIRTSGNFTKGTPKSSYKIKLAKSARFVKMRTLNLKSMWNDVSQMREALAWELFDKADVPGSRHAYARFCINDRYYGLYSVIEQVDGQFLKDNFGKKHDDGNLYKAYWANDDLGPADLTYRAGDDGDDSGRQYFRNDDIENRTYELKSNEDEPTLNNYDDLATLIRVLHGKHTDAEIDFSSTEFEQAIEKVFDVRGFLRWAGVNLLLGAWDNYYGTPANYYLYNGGVETEDEVMAQPFFVWVPWDYDNSFGSDFFGTPWHKTSIINWQKHTRTDAGQLPLVTNLLKNKRYLAYYVDHMECMLDRYFNTSWIDAQIGDEGGQQGIWALIRQSVYLESDTPTGAAHTGRQFTNDQVYWNGYEQFELSHGNHFLMGIWHHVNARHDSARSQIAWLRGEHDLTPPSEEVCGSVP